MQRIRTEQAPLLSKLTGGYHYHRVEYQEDEQLHAAIHQLTQAGIQLLTNGELPIVPER
ncbi:3H domain-containing protein [Alicyclobacillus hesperidum URH17-3-68]|nr:3H domain-containing protein [Alicyclobacillus hesperidum URH17-3-68]